MWGGKILIRCCQQDGVLSCCHSLACAFLPSSSSSFVHIVAKRLCLACHAVALFFITLKKHNKVTKRTWLWVLLYQILGYKEHQISVFWGFYLHLTVLIWLSHNFNIYLCSIKVICNNSFHSLICRWPSKMFVKSWLWRSEIPIHNQPNTEPIVWVSFFINHHFTKPEWF